MDPIIPNSADAEQTSYKRYIDAITAGMFAPQHSAQVARPAADSAEFQPAPARLIGDMVAGMPQGGYASQPDEAVLGGRSILVSGADSAVPTPVPEPETPNLPNDTLTGPGLPIDPGHQTGT